MRITHLHEWVEMIGPSHRPVWHLLFVLPSSMLPNLQGVQASLRTNGDNGLNRSKGSIYQRKVNHNKAQELNKNGTPTPDDTGIGDLSRDDAFYDFAILLKASKQEEIPDVPCDIHSAIGSRIYFKQNPQKAKDHIVKKLREAGLDVQRLRAIDGKQTLVKVKAPQHVLELGAEQMRMKKRRRDDMTWTIFSRDTRNIFADYDPVSGIHFIDSERQSIVHHLITSSHGAGVNDTRYIHMYN